MWWFFAPSNDTCIIKTHILEFLQHQMTHVKNYSIGFWDISNFLSIFAASNDTCMDKHILEPFTASNDTCKELFKRVLGHNQFSEQICSIKWHMHGQTYFLEESPLQHQMTHVKNYSIGFWDITNFLSIFAASNDTCMDKLVFLEESPLQHQMTHIKDYSMGFGT